MRLTGGGAASVAGTSAGLRRSISCPGMAKQVKGGYLLRYKKRLFGKVWKEEWVTLYDDSTLAWFKEKGKVEPEGCLFIKDAPEMMAVGQWTMRIPGRPDLPSGCTLLELMAFGNKRQDKVYWLLAKSEEEVNDWMTAISNTLPPPPRPMKPLDDKDTTPPPTDPVNPRLPPVPYYSSIPGDLTAYNHSNPGAVYPTTVRDRMNNGVGDFATGVLMGAALSNWGHGFGWLPPRGWDHEYSDQHNMIINNHYDHSVHNDINTNNCSCDDYGTDLEFGDADYGMDCSGDFGF